MAKTDWGKLNSDLARMPRGLRIFSLLLVFGIIASALIALGLVKEPDRKAASPLPDIARNKTAIEAYAGAQLLVEQQLKAPSTAKWPPLQDVKAIYNDSSDTWTVVAYVDSQNSLGALVRTRFIAVTNYLGDQKWSLADFTVTE